MCHWCGKRKAMTADHVLAVVDGGTDDLDNLVPACAKCNYSRGGRVGGRGSRVSSTAHDGTGRTADVGSQARHRPPRLT